MAAPTMADWTGQQVANGRYIVGRKLAEGGMAIIYLAQDRNLGNIVVIKAPRAEMLSDKDFTARFTREICSLAELSHPHILKVYDVGQHKGHPFAILQYLPGGSLRDRQQHAADGRVLPMPPDTLRTWLADVAAALDYMHQHDYLHRDIKPDNLLFDEQGQIYLSDLGIAKVLSDQRPETQRPVLTTLGTTIGTPQYMAPELILAQKFDHRVDQYALAVTVYQLLSGRYPFEGTNLTQIFEAQMAGPPPALHTLALAVPTALSATVAKALSKEPKDRFPTCGAFAEAALRTIPNRASQVVPVLPVRTAQNVTVGTVVESKPGKQYVVCSNCGKRQSMPSQLPAGARVRCRQCSTPFPTAVAGEATKQPRGGHPAAPLANPLQSWHRQLLYGDIAAGFLLIFVACLLVGILGFGFNSPPSPPTKDEQRAEKKTSDQRLGPIVVQNKSDDANQTGNRGTQPGTDKKNIKPPPFPTQKDFTNSIGMKLVRIEPGTFWMGSPATEEARGEDESQHAVEITKPFYIGKYEVTQEEYEKVMDRNPSYFSPGGRGKLDGNAGNTKRFPVDSVHWADAKAFCRTLTQRDREQGKISSEAEYTLPTEAEWEYCCRAGTQTPFHFGETISADQANYYADSVYRTGRRGDYRSRPVEVGCFPPNAWGLHDMHGNVSEWCEDWYDEGYYASSPRRDPSGPQRGEKHVLRGGSWVNHPQHCRSAAREVDGLVLRFIGDGFRVVLRLPAPKNSP